MSVRIAVALLAILVGFGSCATQTPFQWNQPAQGHSIESLKLIENSRERQGAITVVTYRIEAAGFPVEIPLELWTRHGSQEAKQGTVVVDQQGTVRWQGTELAGAPPAWTTAGLLVRGMHAATDTSRGKEVLLAHGKYYIAESREWALFDKETSRVAIAKAIPFPLVAEGAGSCRLSVELMSPDGMFFEITVENFQPNEELNFTSQSGEEVLRKGVQYPSSGPLRMGYLPGVIGKGSGEATITFAGERCTVSRKLNWGQAALVVQ
jgi:hypothetical protein